MNFKTLAEKHEILSEALDDYRAMETELNTVKSELEQLRQTINKSGYTVQEVAEGVYELVKDEASELPSGDYINPITFVEGMTVETGKFYTNGDDIWEAMKDGVPTGFDDEEYFDIIK